MIQKILNIFKKKNNKIINNNYCPISIENGRIVPDLRQELIPQYPKNKLITHPLDAETMLYWIATKGK